MNPVIRVENLSKAYRLGQIGGGTLTEDLNRWWARLRKKPDPYLKIGQEDHGNRQGEYIWALKDISFQVQQGEVLGIIGRNGAGKSTLLKILSRVTAPTSGLVKVKGRIASLLEVGTGFHPDLTGRENIYLNGAILGMNKEEVRCKFDEIVDFAEIEKFIDTPVKRYSSGMYVRLAFAVAAHLEPEILLVDEVLAVGDAEFQKKCLGKMGDVAKEGRTVLFVSHNMVSIESLCQKGILIDKGNIAFNGDRNDAISYYLQSGFNGVRKENLRNVKERMGNGKIRFTKIEICDISGKNIEYISSGDDFEFHISYETKEIFETSFVNFEVRCFDSFKNIYIFMHSMRYSGFSTELKDLPRIGKAILRINRLPLKPGSYRITVVVKVYDLTSDSIENAITLDVYEQRNDASGLSYSKLPVIILANGYWRYSESPN